YKLLPGHLLTLTLDSTAPKLTTRCYWDVSYDINGAESEDYFVDRLALLLEEAVSQQLRSDVPIGAHLSGGLDSSAVAGPSYRRILGDRPGEH
ncbi:unnamed protein product, partial [marine sediment metagenome]